MNSEKTIGKIVGVLFLTVMIAWGIGFSLIEPVLSTSDYLENIFPQKIKIMIGVLFEFIEIAAVAGIIIFMFPLIKKYNERMAIGYMSFRILECGVLTLIATSALSLITLSHVCLNATTQDPHAFEMAGTLLKALRNEGTMQAIAVFYSLSALIFQYFLYRTKLVPRFISVWGFISALMVLLVSPFEMLGYKWTGFAGISMGLNELFLGVWLIIKGFNASGMNLLNQIKS